MAMFSEKISEALSAFMSVKRSQFTITLATQKEIDQVNQFKAQLMEVQLRIETLKAKLSRLAQQKQDEASSVARATVRGLNFSEVQIYNPSCRAFASWLAQFEFDLKVVNSNPLKLKKLKEGVSKDHEKT